jgi:hypothetical protein
LAHRRNPDAVVKFDVADCEWTKERAHVRSLELFMSVGLSSLKRFEYGTVSCTTHERLLSWQ